MSILSQELIGGVSSDGRYLFKKEWKGMLRYDLRRNNEPPQLMPSDVGDYSPANGMYVLCDFGERSAIQQYAIRFGLTERPWLILSDENIDHLGNGPVRFSLDGRYLVYLGRREELYVADLPAVRKEVRAFEESIGVK